LVGKEFDNTYASGRLMDEFVKDMILLYKKPDQVRYWEFADLALEAKKPEMVKEILDKIKNDQVLQNKLMKRFNITDKIKFKKFTKQRLVKIVNELMRKI
ncbi:hypothetical protein, partial [Zooshikella harenae]